MASNAVNVAMTNYENQKAAEKEKKRQQRLESGMEQINTLFDGTPSYGNRPKQIDFKTFNPKGKLSANKQTMDYGLPKGVEYRTRAPTKTEIKNWNKEHPGQPLTTMHELVQNGKVIGSATNSKKLAATPVNYQQKYVADRKGGVDKSGIYKTYHDSIVNYENQDLAKQFAKTQEQLAADLARAGTTNSSIATQALADITGQNDVNIGLINSRAAGKEAELRAQQNKLKDDAIAQLYATEDPSMVANQATSAINTLKNTKAEQNPLGEVFKLAAIGGGGFASGFNTGPTVEYNSPINRSAGKSFRA
jgi:hypothetical protein